MKTTFDTHLGKAIVTGLAALTFSFQGCGTKDQSNVPSGTSESFDPSYSYAYGFGHTWQRHIVGLNPIYNHSLGPLVPDSAILATLIKDTLPVASGHGFDLAGQNVGWKIYKPNDSTAFVLTNLRIDPSEARKLPSGLFGALEKHLHCFTDYYAGDDEVCFRSDWSTNPATLQALEQQGR